MKKAKLSLGLIAVLAGGLAMSACDVTAKYGVILTYQTTDANGNTVTVDYTVEDLFGSYSYGTDAATGSFDSVYESLIRNYYAKAGTTAQLADIANRAETAVNSLKQQASQNAASNGTSYAQEWESILSENGCENVDELYAHEEYEIQKELFESNYYNDNLEAIRDGGDERISVQGTLQSTGRKVFANSVDDATATNGYEGYLKERMPYHMSHILANIDGDTSIDQTEISQSDAEQISQIVTGLATGTKFTDIANGSLNDDTSKTDYGDLGIMDKQTSFVPEFKLGTYAFDALYNKKTSAEGYRKTYSEKILPESDVTYGNGEETVRDYFTDKGIGVIPYGAAVALANSAEIDDYNGVPVNNNDATFFPRNILFNKYFNHRNICVIVPTDVPYNFYDANSYTAFTSGTEIDGSKGITGTYDAGYTPTSASTLPGTQTGVTDYSSLPGFQTDTTDVIDFTTFGETDPHGRNTLVDANGKSLHCLTDNNGRIILAVRAASDSYNGVHFIAINRSALDQYANSIGSAIDEATYNAGATTNNYTSLSEYYTTSYVGQSAYPTYTSNNVTNSKTTYNNYIEKETADLISRADTLKTTIRSANSNMSTYIFNSLLAGSATGGSKLTFTTSGTRYGNLVSNYIQTQRDNTKTDEAKTFNDAWADYAEALTYADERRAIGDETGLGYLISEVVAIGYETAAAASNEAGTIFAEGGAGYAA